MPPSMMPSTPSQKPSENLLVIKKLRRDSYLIIKPMEINNLKLSTLSKKNLLTKSLNKKYQKKFKKPNPLKFKPNLNLNPLQHQFKKKKLNLLQKKLKNLKSSSKKNLLPSLKNPLMNLKLKIRRKKLMVKSKRKVKTGQEDLEVIKDLTKEKEETTKEEITKEEEEKDKEVNDKAKAASSTTSLSMKRRMPSQQERDAREVHHLQVHHLRR